MARSRPLIVLAVAVVAVSVLLLSTLGSAHAVTLVVDSSGDGADVEPGDGLCDDGSGQCTLRAALDEANANAGTDTIAFDIPGAGPHTIRPAAPLPVISDMLVIDGYSQSGARASTNPPGLGSNAVLMIELDGTSAGPGATGLQIAWGGTIVRGITINRFDRDGVLLRVNGGNVIEGSFIGTDVTGTIALGNGESGVWISNSDGNTIGGASPAASNLLSGNGVRGVLISGSSSGNVVEGNLIGTDLTGTVALPNGMVGVNIVDAPGNMVGGGTVGGRNVISGNWKGIEISHEGATGNLVRGNLVGTQVDGAATLRNGSAGIVVAAGAGRNVIGGAADSSNTIAHNGGDGVRVVSGTGNAIDLNSIFSNEEEGIDLNDDGPTPNDPGDADAGANRGQNFPEITSVEIDFGGEVTIEYRVDSTVESSAYPLLVEFFAADGAGEEGRTFLGSDVYPRGSARTTVTANLGSTAGLGVAEGDLVLATATDAAGNTSEFSLPGVAVTAACASEVRLSFADGIITWNFVVGAAHPSTWSVSAIIAGNLIPLWSIDLPPLPPIAVSFSFPIPSIGVVEVQSTLSVEGAQCAASDAVDTGGS